MLIQKSLLSIEDLTNQEIFLLLELANKIDQSPHLYSELCKNKIMSLLFFEASTRTYFSFCSAMQRLGGNILGFPQSTGTSISKGESLEDTARMMACYSDIMIMRHPSVNILPDIKSIINIPLINAGEGVGEHPTQTLTDLFTIYKIFNRFDICIGLYGDLKFGRTNHSLILAGSRLGANFICIAPDELQMPDHYLNRAKENNINIELSHEITPYAKKIDVLYVSRLQKERLAKTLNYEYLKEQFKIDLPLANTLKSSAIILHPLPRVGEIEPAVDLNPRAKYFEQAANSVSMRMAIILYCLGINPVEGI